MMRGPIKLPAEKAIDQGQRGLEPISLVIPCRPEYVGFCRLVAGVVGQRQSLDEETIADLKLVVTEACTCFVLSDEEQPVLSQMSAGSDASCSLRVDFQVSPGLWEITVSDPDHRRHLVLPNPCDPLSGGGLGLGLTIINALVDCLEHTDSEAEGSVLRLIKHLPAAQDLPA
jgi:anti-sigma regulatory factor (Ser/Thr protein kinase)